jgi:hypothetical protein
MFLWLKFAVVQCNDTNQQLSCRKFKTWQGARLAGIQAAVLNTAFIDDDDDDERGSGGGGEGSEEDEEVRRRRK